MKWLKGTEKNTARTMEDNCIIRLLQWTIDFIEAAIMRLSILFLTAGAILGTIATLAPQFHLSSIPAYNLTWAIVQAVALDGLLIGVLFLLRDNWKVYDVPSRAWYGAIAILLGTVAALVNTTLAYQELHQLSSVVEAMNQLGISQATFSYTRAILVVLVTALVCTLPRKHTQQKVEVPQQTVEEAVNQAVAGIQGELMEVKSLLYRISMVDSGIKMVDDNYTNGINVIPQSNYDRVREYIESNPGVRNRDIVVELGIPESTVKAYAAKARKERITDSIPVVEGIRQ